MLVMSDPNRKIFAACFRLLRSPGTTFPARDLSRAGTRRLAGVFLLGMGLVCTGCGDASHEAQQRALDSTIVPAELSSDLVAAPLKPRSSESEIVLASGTTSEAAPSTADGMAAAPTLEEGSPEWLIHEIARLRAAPADVIRQPVPGDRGTSQEVRLSPEQAAQEQKRRNEETVQLAMQAIAKTHQDPSREQLFNSAVHYLADARMQLALAGDEHQLRLMVENADALFERDSTSFAAVEAAGRLLQLTQTQAQQFGEQDARWGLAFARQSQLFADRFPQETSRAAVNLIAAARMCEQFQQPKEALACYTVVEQKFPGTPFSEQVAGPLRRLRLPGKPLEEFGGSTHDGGFLSLEQLRGKPLLVVFWASNSARFQEDLPALKAALAKHSGHLTAVGVNFDRDERAVDAFLEHASLGWKQIFYSDPEKRGAYNPVARYYGVMNVPQYWLVDAQGIVRSVDLQVSELNQVLTAFAE
jgi:hypothetical protein